MPEEHEKLPAAVELGRLGGHARAKALTPKQRAEISRQAANTRWEAWRKKNKNKKKKAEEE